MNKYTPYEYKGETMLVERYLVLGEQECEPTKYDLFDMMPSPFAIARIDDIAQGGYADYKLFTEQNYEFFNSFKNYPNPENKKIFLYAEVFSKTKTKIIVNIMCAKWGKLWVNGKCLSIHHYDGAAQYFGTLYLNKGKNIFLLEQYSPKNSNTVSIQLRNYKFEMGNDFRALSKLGNTVRIDPLVLIKEALYNTEGTSLKFMYMKNGNDTYLNDYKINIHDSSIGLVNSLNAKINEVVEIDIAELRALHEETLRHERVECTFKKKDGQDFVTNFSIVLNDFNDKRIEINNRALVCGKELSPEVHENIVGRLGRQYLFEKNNDNTSLYWHTWQLKEFISGIEKGNYPHGSYKNSGPQEFYIHSDLDDSTIRMVARIPKNYDKNKPYPVIMALSTGNYGWFCWGPIEENIVEPCLCFDVTGRGFNGGSYIGEASTIQIFDWIKKNYKIDENRLYILGQSNGGYATYSIAQNHPHLAAAIFPQIGNPYMKTIDNLLNTPVYQMVSPKDHLFVGHENDVKKAIGKYKNYNQYDFKEMVHESFVQYIYHKDVLNDMLKATRNLYPEKVIFTTERNRHLESFWIRLHGIAKNKRSAMVKADIISNKLIKVVVMGADGITITIPPQIEREEFIVNINNKIFTLKKYENRELIFIRGKEWTITEKELPIDCRKGTGLLDVYLNSMRIILPKNESEVLRKIAENFARPHSNGFDPVIYTNYPIYLDSEVPEHIFSYNLILFDVLDTNQCVKRLKDKLMVQYDNTGYTYKGVHVDTEYVIMQVVPNPYNSALSIMVISTNSESLLQKNLFTRKLIIPYYRNGINPYLNNEVLIFNGEGYLGIYEADADIDEIK